MVASVPTTPLKVLILAVVPHLSIPANIVRLMNVLRKTARRILSAPSKMERLLADAYQDIKVIKFIGI